jgi:hypothetical protein
MPTWKTTAMPNPAATTSRVWAGPNDLYNCDGELDTADDEPDNDAEEDDPPEDGGDSEPDLGAFDRMMNQEKSWRQREGETWYSRSDEVGHRLTEHDQRVRERLLESARAKPRSPFDSGRAVIMRAGKVVRHVR